MDIQLLKTPDVQAKMRAFVGKILIEEGVTLAELAKLAKVGAPQLTWFLKSNMSGRVGIKTLLRMAHFLTTKGYDLEKELA